MDLMTGQCWSTLGMIVGSQFLVLMLHNWVFVCLFFLRLMINVLLGVCVCVNVNLVCNGQCSVVCCFSRENALRKSGSYLRCLFHTVCFQCKQSVTIDCSGEVPYSYVL